MQRRKNSTLDSQGREAFDLQALRKNISETTRLLYVAMTRARKQLILTRTITDSDKFLTPEMIRRMEQWAQAKNWQTP